MFNRTILLAGVAGLAVLAGSVSVSADDRGARRHGPKIDFSEVDTNSDGKLSQDELKAHAVARFAKADTDGDGMLSSAELVAQAEARADQARSKRFDRMAERMLNRADDNKDGNLSMEEMMPADRDQARMFDRLDRDDDGAISEQEFAQMQERSKGRGDRDHDQKRGEHRKGDGDHGQGMKWRNAPDNN
ncbi:EF-hand domain-containing protein [Pseudooceanicola sp.]|uniref:EF-hand domain-containing protein n=1 Tax=Pseudooceanicola sp. TaxID=1914328 RepID=UPI0026059326|nr:EF-hand domain-containing protein [Pseudooceanicola sp.]MDF1854844.1 EF-hand domain-containing protein [Pseudooceanicola sp.]